MRYIKPKPGQSDDFFCAVMGSGDSVTFVRSGYYIVPESVFNLLNNQQIKFTEIDPVTLKPVNPK